MIIKIPEGEYCEDCHFSEGVDGLCYLFIWEVPLQVSTCGLKFKKCKECLNNEPVEVVYE